MQIPAAFPCVSNRGSVAAEDTFDASREPPRVHPIYLTGLRAMQ